MRFLGSHIAWGTPGSVDSNWGLNIFGGKCKEVRSVRRVTKGSVQNFLVCFFGEGWKEGVGERRKHFRNSLARNKI